MRTFLLSILWIFLDLGCAQGQCPNTSPTFWIPSAGCTQDLSYAQIQGQTFFVTTQGAVNLGSNTFVLTYSSLPGATAQWNVIFHADSLTVSTGTNVNLFGVTPLASFVGQKDFYFQINVEWGQYGGEVKTVNYFASLFDLTNNLNPTTYDSTLTVQGTFTSDSRTILRGQLFYNSGGAQQTGDVLQFGTDTAIGVSSCPMWPICGIGGTNGSIDFVGTTDTASLSFRVNNLAAGIVSYNSGNTALGSQAFTTNTTGINDVAIGVAALYYNTTGYGNTAVGHSALDFNTTGYYNTAIGYNADYNNTSGNNNVAVGYRAMAANTTGGANTVLGYQAALSLTTGTQNVILGSGANVASSSASNAVAINGTASPNQFTVGGVENIFLPGVNSGVGYDLRDTSGTGNFVPQKQFGNTGTIYTPVTGDSIANVSGVQTSKNTVNPAGTLANLTIVFPANPIPFQAYFFNFQQAITSLHYSIRLSGGANPQGLPSSEAQYGTFSCYYDNNINTWVAASH